MFEDKVTESSKKRLKKFGETGRREEWWLLCVVLDEEGQGAGEEGEDEAVDCCWWGGVAQISITTMDFDSAVIRWLLTLVGARTIDHIMVFVVFIRDYNFFLQTHEQAS